METLTQIRDQDELSSLQCFASHMKQNLFQVPLKMQERAGDLSPRNESGLSAETWRGLTHLLCIFIMCQYEAVFATKEKRREKK